MSDQDRIAEICARLDAATLDGWDFDSDQTNADVALINHAPADIAWLIGRERRLAGALGAFLDATKWHGPALSTKEVVALLEDHGLTLGEFGQRW